MKPKTQTTIAIVVLILDASMGAIMWPIDHGRAAALLITTACFAFVWGVTKWLHRSSRCNWSESRVRKEIVSAIILAGLILLGSISASMAKEFGMIDAELSKRIVGIIIGIVLIVMGNYMPKKLVALGDTNCSHTKSQSIQRFMGWTFVIAGMLYAGVWIVFDLDQAGFVIMLTFPAAIVLIIIARMLFLRVTGARRHSEPST